MRYKAKKLDKYQLVDKETGIRMNLYQDNVGVGLDMEEIWGVTSANSLMYLEQLDMRYFYVREVKEGEDNE